MNKSLIPLVFLGMILIFACSEKDEGPSERFQLLTTPTWTSDSLLVNGFDASGPGQTLENFKGDAKFNPDGTGTFGVFSGYWSFQQNETQIVIVTTQLPIALTTLVNELTPASLKITTAYPNPANPNENMNIRMTFVVK